MKKLATILMTVLLIVSMSVIAFAADTQTTEITMTIDPSMESYTLTIPATVQIDPNQKSGTVNVGLSDVNLVWNTKLTVYATSKNHVDGEDGSYLVNTSDSTKKISYSVVGTAGDTSFEAHEQGLYVARYTAAHEYGYSHPEQLEDGGIELTVDGNYPGSGTYTDTLTFTVVFETLADMYS